MLDLLNKLLYRSTRNNNGYPFYLGYERSRLLRRVNKVTGKQTSTIYRNFMKFWYVESQKPTRDARSWVIGMAEAGFNINYVAFHFDTHKTIAYRIINCFVQTKMAGYRPKSDRKKKNNSTGGMSHSDHIMTVAFVTATPLCITSKECLWYVSVDRNCPEPCPMHVENVQNIDILSF